MKFNEVSMEEFEKDMKKILDKYSSDEIIDLFEEYSHEEKNKESEIYVKNNFLNNKNNIEKLAKELEYNKLFYSQDISNKYKETYLCESIENYREWVA